MSIRLEVLRDHLASASASETAGSRADTVGEPAPLQSPAVQGSQALAPGGPQPAAPSTAGEGSGVHPQPVSPTVRGDGGGAQPRGFASSLLSRWGFFKRGSEEVEAAVAQAPASDKAAAARLRFQHPYVRIHFKVGSLRSLTAAACGCTRLQRRVSMYLKCWRFQTEVHKAAAAVCMRQHWVAACNAELWSLASILQLACWRLPASSEGGLL